VLQSRTHGPLVLLIAWCSPHLHRLDNAGCERALLPESTLQSMHDLFQVNPMSV
jgi:hypothetical protein